MLLLFAEWVMKYDLYNLVVKQEQGTHKNTHLMLMLWNLFSLTTDSTIHQLMHNSMSLDD